MTNQEAIDLIIRNKSVFQFDSDMLDALTVAIGAIKRDSRVDDITFHWNDNNHGFMSACVAFEEILKVYGRGVEEK